MLSGKKLKEKILKDRYNSIIFKKGRGRELYLVGGYVRDILMGKTSQDRDYIVSNEIRDFVNSVRKDIGGTLIEFKKGDTMRLALKEGVTIDFSRPLGTLKEDLSKRDFTINAIAWSPDTGIIDPYKGLEDIKNKRICSISEKNMISDPLRMLRAYRFAAEFNGSIENKTRKSIKMLYNHIKTVSPERITFELFNLLNSDNPYKYLKMALYDGILRAILCFCNNKLEDNVKAISILKRKIIEHPKKVKVLLEKTFSQNLTYKGLLYLELLVRKNGTFKIEKIPSIRMSKKIIKRIILAHKGMKEFKRGRLFDIFSESIEASVDILLIKNRIDLLKEYERFKKVWKKGVLRSLEVASITKIKGSPKLGEAIKEIKRAEFEKKIKNKKQGKEFLIRYFT
jgi:tRNA nucleotidyltransferase/poly(A) polymerase